jgi:hypothetical protein
MTINKRNGFALVATLLLMVLIAVAAIGLLGLSSVELRKSSSLLPSARAKANARMAMMIALGELQRNLGPDQRVSADARVVLGGNSKPANPHWLSVWKTTKDNGTPWITRNAEKGGLQDQRNALGWNAATNRIACLVSGNESALQHSDDELGDESTMAMLVGRGTLGESAEPEALVKAPKVAFDSGAGYKGSYAWWIGDLGAKANVATRDSSPIIAGRRHGELLAQDQSLVAFGAPDAEDEQRKRFVSDSAIRFAKVPEPGSHFHDMTVWSAAMPINVREGGWKRDLTAYLESNGTIPALRVGGTELLGLADSDNLVGPANARADALSGNPRQAERFKEISPNFGLLRTWAKRSETNGEGTDTMEMETGEIIPVSTGGRNSKSVDYKERTTTHLMPVLTEGSIYYNLSYYEPPRPTAAAPLGLRVHYYPRVALWNPYNFTLKVPPSAMFFQINGSKSVEITLRNAQRAKYRMFWGLGGSRTGGAVRGSMFFQMEGATLRPGETQVWSPSRNNRYDESNFSSNLLSPEVAPSPSRSFFQDSRLDTQPLFQPLQSGGTTLAQPNTLTATPLEWREIVPPKPNGNIQDAAEPWTQADDYIMSWKPLTGNLTNEQSFGNMPMGRFISCAFQYGDEDELPVEWTANDPVPIQRSSNANPSVTMAPDRRTRDGFRLRWFDEPVSNVIGSGSLANRPHLEDAAVGNWNLRASWAYRNPFDNVSDVAPHFFGIFTRDLFDGDVDWAGMTPRFKGGRSLGAPFDQAARSNEANILFDIPRKGAEIASLGAFQHINFSEFIWHPTYALGNSVADPRIERNKTEPDRSNAINRDRGGWNENSIGWTTDGRSGNDNGLTTDEDNWAWHARNFLQEAALDQNLVYDLSYELNHSLWDAYFLSTGTKTEKEAFLEDPENKPLPNGRIQINRMHGSIKSEDLANYHRSAPALLVDGAFNINSTSVKAWESLLLSGLGKHGTDDGIAFPRTLDLPWRELGWNGPQGSGRHGMD